MVFIGCAAVGVDMSRWSVEAERVQRAADAAALAGVVWMPADFATAKSTALTEAKKNGYDDASSKVTVTVSEGDKPSQLVVKVSSTVANSFGQAIGTPNTTIGRSATADYAGGLSMGSPCNEFGSDPYGTATYKSTNCSDAGDFWANVGSLKASKGSGDAFQDNACGNGFDRCTTSSGPNEDYDANGYIYEVNVTAAMSNLQLEAFDPALISVGDHCGVNLDGAASITNAAVSDPSTRYAKGDGPFCTGDNDFDTNSSGFANQVATSFTVRQMGTASDPTRPYTWPVVNSSTCPGAKVYPGYDGNLSKALDKSLPSNYQTYVAANFRQWVTLCTMGSVAKGTTFAIQVKTNGNGFDNANGHNRFSLRGYSSASPSANNNLSISAFNKMAVYANVSSGSSRFFLTRVPSSAHGQMLNVNLYDIGDITGTGTIKFVAPAESGTTFSNCRAVGVKNGLISNCEFTASGSFNGRWQTSTSPFRTRTTATTIVDGLLGQALLRPQRRVANAGHHVVVRPSIDGDPVRLVK